MNFLATLKIIGAALPIIIQLVTQVEAAFPVKGQGAAKLELVKQMLQGASELSDDLSAGRFDLAWPALQQTINGIVGLANASGIFKK